jgi:hypothetical protein
MLLLVELPFMIKLSLINSLLFLSNELLSISEVAYKPPPSPPANLLPYFSLICGKGLLVQGLL